MQPRRINSAAFLPPCDDNEKNSEVKQFWNSFPLVPSLHKYLLNSNMYQASYEVLSRKQF